MSPDRSDPRLPLLAELLDPAAAAELVETALDRGPIESVRIIDVAYRPSASITVRYAARLPGETDPVTLVAMHGGDVPVGGVRVSDGSNEVSFWRYPDDPGLPGLAPVLDPPRLARLLMALGIKGSEPRTRVRAYRPGRRAVVEIEMSGHHLFAKVVRPKRVAELQGIHAALAPVVPIPRSRGWHPELGLVFMDAIPGSPLAATLVAGGGGAVAGPDDLIALLDLIATVSVDARPRPGPLARATDHAATLRLLLPEAAESLAAVVAAASQAPEVEPITAHRDFHAAQLLVSENRLRLVDVDTVGIGSRSDDLAIMIAQLICLGRPGPGAAVVETYRTIAEESFERQVGREALRPRIAAALLGFAQGPFRVQEPGWRQEAERRIAAARSTA